MIDIKFLRENPEIVKENIKKKFQDSKLALVDEVIELDKQNRAAKTKADELFRDLGTDTTTAIRMFLTQAVANNGFPFEIKRNDKIENPYKYLPSCSKSQKYGASSLKISFT